MADASAGDFTLRKLLERTQCIQATIRTRPADISDKGKWSNVPLSVTLKATRKVGDY